MNFRQSLLVAGSLVARAGWAPLLVFLLHVFISRVLNGYILFPPLDIPMHLFGGIAMAYFLSCCFTAIPEGVVAGRFRTLAECVVVLSLTATASVCWEFAEYLSDALFGTQAQLGLEDTLLDMALGILGAVSYLLVALQRGLVGTIAPLGLREQD